MFGKEGPISTSKLLIDELDMGKVNQKNFPLFYYPGKDTKLVGVSIIRDVLHLIPIKNQNVEFTLSEPLVVYTGTYNIQDITSMNSYLNKSKLRYVTVENGVSQIEPQNRIEVYEIDTNDSIVNIETATPFNRNITKKFSRIGTYNSQKVIHKVFSMPFGGFLATTETKIMYFSHDNCTTPTSSKGFIKRKTEIVEVRPPPFFGTS